MTAQFEQLVRIGLAIEMILNALMLLSLVATVCRRRYRAHDDARRMAEGRERLARALQGGNMVTTHSWLTTQPARIQLALCRSFVLSVHGATRRNVQVLALRLGVVDRATADVQSRRWNRRLHGTRVLGMLAPPDFGESLRSGLQHDPHAAVRQAAREWSAALPLTMQRSLDHTLSGHDGGADGRAIVDDATRALTDAQTEVRTSEIRVLAGLAHWPAASSVYPLLDDPEFVVRREAATALYRFGAPGQLLLRRALADASARARDAAQFTLDLHRLLSTGAQ